MKEINPSNPYSGYNSSLTKANLRQKGIVLNNFNNFLVMLKGNLYTKEDYLQRLTSDSFLPETNNIRSLRDKESLQKIVTDLFSTRFLNNYLNREKLVKFINTIFKNGLKMYEKIKPEYKEYRPLIKFIYKGGMTLRLLGYQYKQQFSIIIEEIIEKEYAEFFNISDNDFEIFIMLPHHKSDMTPAKKTKIEKAYNKIYNELSIMTYFILQKVTSLFNSTSERTFFDYFSFDKVKQSNILQESFELFKKEIDKQKEDVAYTFKNIKSVDAILASNDIAFPPEKYDQINKDYKPWNTVSSSLNDPTNNTRGNSIVIKDKNDNDISNPRFLISDKILSKLVTNETIKNSILQTKSGSFYCTFNPVINVSKKYHFSLNRIKYNFRLLTTTASYQKKYINLGAEVVDIAIRSYNDWKLVYFSPQDYADYKYKSKTNSFEYLGYSLIGNITDLLLVLFKESRDRNSNSHPTDDMTVNFWFTEPWLNNKYKKRMRRLFYLLFLNIMKCESSYYCTDIDKSIELISLFRKAIDEFNLPKLIGNLNELLETIYQYENIELEQFETISRIEDRKYKEFMELKDYVLIILFIYILKEMLVWFSSEKAGEKRIQGNNLNTWGKYKEFIKSIDKELIKINKILARIKGASMSELKINKKIKTISSLGFRDNI